jgi:hypothetical protein
MIGSINFRQARFLANLFAESPAACRGVSEQHENGLFLLSIEDSPQLAAESFNCIVILSTLRP